jgi:hypothetical protein
LRPSIFCCALSSKTGRFSETAFLHSGLPFSVLSQPYTANGNGVFQANGPQFASRVPASRSIKSPRSPESPLPEPGNGSIPTHLSPSSIPPPATARVIGEPDTPANCQFGDAGRNTCAARTSLTPTSTSRAGSPSGSSYLRFDVQMFNAFNHPNFALPSSVQAGVPANTFRPNLEPCKAPSHPQPACSAFGLGGDSESPRMIAFQARSAEF